MTDDAKHISVDAEEYKEFNYPNFVDGLLAKSEILPDSLSCDILRSAVGISGEVGELLNHIEKVIWQGHCLSPNYIIKELGDILFYFQSMCNCVGTDIDEVRKENIEKLIERYPDGVFDKERSINRNE